MTYTAVFGESERVKKFFGVRKGAGLSNVGAEAYSTDLDERDGEILYTGSVNVTHFVDVNHLLVNNASCIVFLDSGNSSDEEKFKKVCDKAAKQYLPVIRVKAEEKENVAVRIYTPSVSAEPYDEAVYCSTKEAKQRLPQLVAVLGFLRQTYVPTAKTSFDEVKKPVLTEQAKEGYFAKVKQAFKDVFAGVSATLTGFFGRSFAAKSVGKGLGKSDGQVQQGIPVAIATAPVTGVVCK